ncbi:MAG: hypothetical protein A2268_01605 [Candidatus Raymondbacteria bacterium RifOxyA12_full_50_37]|uniref:STAS domain-containing protein n=1 Tax=Candidatus Raymondbacteria bacterium RIFOXYD12_FULL_49_13 TaxID=1817890 RepID=A0A1F7F9Y1_UNCRA|nr:MAG: hypothetical protein A2268_01605 [Candidatus Raymondbacteria bacterium RifOxyA12_full_50_37]OGJ87761.1 MAG: hypothetical protein A2248_07210 [Candidatus Raymondbacteria bacterium RIFOXYA2_FULL_49_16]OGJ94744.1 MAG: hypothetical protein A2350_12335 [Candidatus Raymondbacteria bacterium RifOxyB12_full_50_8]OGJ95639.1 MAG: hypothetical protein A2453_13205 [Candidatus Raymondbacteria bacterium RIFOXYC2_FULL_50_21]OGK03411.1 MAG: hypothetical protein A2519_15480 [Candidatus Raymondbacteria b
MNYENNIIYNETAKEVVVSITGTFALPGDPPLSRTLEPYFKKDLKKITINISNLTMITSTGIRHLIILKEYAVNTATKLVLRCSNTQIYNSLCDLNLDAVFVIEKSD